MCISISANNNISVSSSEISINFYISNEKVKSRHTVVCRAAQEAGAQPREYIDRKKENAIFAPP